MRRFVSCCAIVIACFAWSAAARAAAGPATIQLTEERAISLDELMESGGRCATLDDGRIDLPREPRGGAHPSLDAAAPPRRIPVAFHVLYKETTRNRKLVRIGDVSRTQLERQIDVLNAAFKPAGLSFFLASVDRTKNSAWFEMVPASRAELEAKQALAIDPARTLNIYTAAPSNNLLGWAYYPWAYNEKSMWHGLVLLYSTLPGGSAAPYNLGDTATHEIGHYLGLYHTFANGCSSVGDFVNDTPAEANAAYGCPGKRDTCRGPGLDPIHNYMDYVDDDCMHEFTAGQVARMEWALRTYKRILAATRTSAQSTEPAEQPTLALRLRGARPNPFNPTTTIEFWLARSSYVSLHVYDVAGRRVAALIDGERAAGEQHIVFEGRGLPSGIYMAVLQQGDQKQSTRLILLK